MAERVVLLGGGEAALRRQAQLVDVDEPRRLLDPAFERVLRLQFAGLGGDQPELYGLALRQYWVRLLVAVDECSTS